MQKNVVEGLPGPMGGAAWLNGSWPRQPGHCHGLVWPSAPPIQQERLRLSAAIFSLQV